MQITNKHNINKVIHTVIEKITRQQFASKEDAYIRVTDIIRPSHQFALIEKHFDEIKMDVTETIFTMIGTAVHGLIAKHIEHIPALVKFAEKRFQTVFSNTTISGQIDLYMDGTLTDFKTSGVWGLTSSSRSKKIAEWTKQLNIYKYFLEKNNIDVYSLEIVVIYRDWSRAIAEKNDDYPKLCYDTVKIEILPNHEIEEYITNQLEKINIARQGHTEECSDEDKWKKKYLFKVMKEGAKRATRSKIEDYETAKEIKDSLDGNYKIIQEGGKPTRCLYYCNVKEYCPFYKNYIKNNKELLTNEN